MVEIIRAGGWLMLPIILCSIVAIAIVIERFWSLSATRITPKHTLAQVWTWLKNNQLDSSKLRELRLSSPLGEVLAAGLLTSKHGRAAMIESIEQGAAQVIHDMERYLSTLGTIAAITPLLGLLGTVVGIDIHSRWAHRRNTYLYMASPLYAKGRIPSTDPGAGIDQTGRCAAQRP